MLARLFVCGVFAFGDWSLAATVQADDFHVTTDFYSDGAKTPASTNLTVFFGGRVYDFLTHHSAGDHTESQISIFDPVKGRFVLLDPARQVKVEIERDRMVELTGSLRTWLSAQSDPLKKFCADPKFTETSGGKENEILFNSPVLSYRVVSFAPDSPDVAKQYREFTDAFARLNTVTNPGSLPPFPRLAVNAALAQRNAVPREVELTIPAKNRLLDRPIVRRTEHLFDWHVTPGDEEKISKAGQWLAEFSKVSLDEYVRPSPGTPQK